MELTNGNAAVIASARDVASKNKATTEDVVINDADVEFGWYDIPTRTFTTPSESVNSIRVTARVVNKALFWFIRRFDSSVLDIRVRAAGRFRTNGVRL